MRTSSSGGVVMDLDLGLTPLFQACLGSSFRDSPGTLDDVYPLLSSQVGGGGLRPGREERDGRSAQRESAKPGARSG